MRIIQPIETGCYYHIYNCGINGVNLFETPDNYQYFMGLYDKYIERVAETYAWCLMPNHFHVLLCIKDENAIVANHTTPERVQKPFRGNEANKIQKYITQQFSNLFNSYAQAFNKRNNRHGSLFEKPFKRKLIDNDSYFQNLVLYIHNNPVHHSFCEHPMEWGWSSYLTCLSEKPTKVKRKDVIDWFGDVENFKHVHNNKVDVTKMNEWLEL